MISEADFLRELQTQQAYFARKDGYVGLAHFVKFYLGAKGFDFASSYTMADGLKAKGIVEIYEVPNPAGDDPIKAIRLAESVAPKPKVGQV